MMKKLLAYTKGRMAVEMALLCFDFTAISGRLQIGET